VNSKNVKLFLAIAAFGAAVATPASASSISAVVNTGGKATFTNGVLTGFSGLTLADISTTFGGTITTYNAAAGDVTVTVSGSNVLFTALAGAFTGALANLNGNGAFLTISLASPTFSGTQPSLTEAYGGGTGMLSAAAAADLSVTTALTNFSNTFSANTCSSGCGGTTGPSVNGVFNISSNTNTYLVTATPEPGSFFLLGVSMLATVVLYKRKALVPSPAAKRI
jgi:hypothetical protein